MTVTYYGPPFAPVNSFGTIIFLPTIDEAIDDWWAKYRAVYTPANFPGCSYGRHNFPSGKTTNHFFVGVTLTGGCMGTGSFVGTQYFYDSNKNLGKYCPACGNPINPATGNKYQRENDYVSSVGPLQFVRHYNSGADSAGRLGSNWRHTYERRVDYDDTVLPPTAAILRPDGKSQLFTFYGTKWVTDADVNDRLTRFLDGSGNVTGWSLLVAATEDTESYDKDGRLTTITSSTSVVQTLLYTGVNLSTVTDSFGHALSFTYDAMGRIDTMTDPASGVFHYGFPWIHGVSLRYW